MTPYTTFDNNSAEGQSGAITGAVIGTLSGGLVTPAAEIVDGTQVLANTLVQAVATEGSVLVDLGGDVMEEIDKTARKAPDDEEKEREIRP